MYFADTGTSGIAEKSSTEKPRPDLGRLPPSAKLVFKVLESGGLLTQKDIVARTYLPARTVRYALTRLKEVDMLQERFYFQDARQSLYGLNPSAVEVMVL